MKTCRKCGGTDLNKWSVCRPCKKEYNHARKDRANILKRKIRYGLTEEDFTRKLEEQEHKCAICTKDISDEFILDHNHRCCQGQKACENCVRGLLCRKCNMALGLFDDNPEIVGQAMDYLLRWK